ncbi:hypothetical protein L9F63_010732, partial [Diploptera punctata]
VHLLREKLELCNKDGAHATVVHLDSPRSGRPTTAAIPQNFNISYGAVLYDIVHENLKFRKESSQVMSRGRTTTRPKQSRHQWSGNMLVPLCGSEISSTQMATLQPNGLLRTGHIET